MAYNGTVNSSPIAALPPAGGVVYLSSAMFCGEGTNTAILRVLIDSVVTPSSPLTMEKTNTRSPTATASYFISNVSGGRILIVMVVNTAMRVRWTAARCQIVINDGDSATGLDFSVATATPMFTGSFFESPPRGTSTRGARRVTRRGLFQIFGNQIQMPSTVTRPRQPIFFNDLAWRDQFSYRIGKSNEGTQPFVVVANRRHALPSLGVGA